MQNIVYCFDENYNLQAFTSIISLLDNISKKVNIHIIHKTEDSQDFIPKVILEHNKLEELKIYKFKKQNYDYPNVFNAHVSEATYYRLFIEDYLPSQIDNFIYLDADIICCNDPIPIMDEIIFKLKKSNKIISAVSEIKNNNDKRIKKVVFDRLDMKSGDYFNAGVLFIDYYAWYSSKPKKELLNILIEKNQKLTFWDQDILNSYFDGDYIELDKEFNYVIDLATYMYTLKRKYKYKKISIDEITNKNVFLHYAGSHKPWSVDGIVCNLSEIYHHNFRKISNYKYHIVHKRKRISINYFIKNFINLNIFKIKYFFGFMRAFFRSFF